MIESILSPTHLLLILVVALIVLGPKRLPEAGRGLGSAIRGFKDSLSTAERREEQPANQPSREPDHTPDAEPWEGAIRMEAFPDSTLAQQPRLVRQTSERMQHERAPNL
jgi:sec-independent protein translocase protein TatA